MIEARDRRGTVLAVGDRVVDHSNIYGQGEHVVAGIWPRRDVVGGVVVAIDDCRYGALHPSSLERVEP